MSMNIHIVSKIDTLLASGEIRIIQEDFGLWQTPTKITKQILESRNRFNEYERWVMNITESEILPIYAQYDPFGDSEPIGTKEVHVGEEHIKELRKWIKDHSDEEWIIEWFMI